MNPSVRNRALSAQGVSHKSVGPPFGRAQMLLTRQRLTAGELYVWFVALTTLIAQGGRFSVLGFNLGGWMWVLPSLVAIACLMLCRRRWALPFIAFLPFLAYMALRTDSLSQDAVQRVGLFMSPVLVGAAASQLRLGSARSVRNAYTVLFFASVALYAAGVVQQKTFRLGGWYSIGGASKTFALLGVAAVAESQWRSRRGYVALALIWTLCFVSASRMPAMVLPAVLILGSSRLTVHRRLALSVAIIAGGLLLLFPSKPMQRMLFRSGEGTFAELLELDPSRLHSGGRLTAWPMYIDAIRKSDFLLGAGGLESTRFGGETFGGWSHPHNEYIRLVFEYGAIGAALYLGSLLYLLGSCYRRRRSGPPELLWLWHVGWVGLVAFMLLAVTGNTFVYAPFIGNMLFVTIGAAFAVSSETYEHHSLIERYKLRIFRPRPAVAARV